MTDIDKDFETVRAALADYYSDWTELTDPASIPALDRIERDNRRMKLLYEVVPPEKDALTRIAELEDLVEEKQGNATGFWDDLKVAEARIAELEAERSLPVREAVARERAQQVAGRDDV